MIFQTLNKLNKADTSLCLSLKHLFLDPYRSGELNPSNRKQARNHATGIRSPRSHRARVLGSTPIWRAKSLWLIPCAFRWLTSRCAKVSHFRRGSNPRNSTTLGM